MRLRMDWLLFGTILVMVSFGLVMVYSASSVTQELKKNAKAAEVIASGRPSEAPAAPAPARPFFGFSLRRLFAAVLGVVALRFFWRNYRLGIFTRPWAILGTSLVLFLQLLAYWMDTEKSPHWALLVRQAGAALGGFFLMMWLSQRDYRQFRTAQWAFST